MRAVDMNSTHGLSQHFVAVATAGDSRVLGYYALSAGAVAFQHVPNELKKRLSRQKEKLQTLVSPAVRVERGLLRDLRMLRPGTEIDVGTEFDLWDSDQTYGKILGFSLIPSALKQGMDWFALLSDERLRAVVQLIQQHQSF